MPTQYYKFWLGKKTKGQQRMDNPETQVTLNTIRRNNACNSNNLYIYLHELKLITGLGLWCLMPHLTIFQLYWDGKMYYKLYGSIILLCYTHLNF